MLLNSSKYVRNDILTPRHLLTCYAGFVSNPSLFSLQILKGAGAKEDLADALGQTPQFYLENKASGQLDLKVYSLLILVLLRHF